MEIDETKLGHRKYEIGRRLDRQWILGGVQRGSKNIFLEIVPDRSKETLCNVIQQHVLPYTTIMTDCWKPYNSLSALGNTINMALKHYYCNIH